jgi:hypothetical protein
MIILEGINMSDYFEYRNDPELMTLVAGTSHQVCRVKMIAYKACADYVRKMSVTGDREAARLCDLLERAAITPETVDA